MECQSSVFLYFLIILFWAHLYSFPFPFCLFFVSELTMLYIIFSDLFSMPVNFDTQYDQGHSQNILILLTTKSSAKAEKYLAMNLSKLNIFTFSLPTQSTNLEYNFLPHISGKAGRIITSC